VKSIMTQRCKTKGVIITRLHFYTIKRNSLTKLFYGIGSLNNSYLCETVNKREHKEGCCQVGNVLSEWKDQIVLTNITLLSYCIVAITYSLKVNILFTWVSDLWHDELGGECLKNYEKNTKISKIRKI
jgi:hypothetical protein